ncbi:RESPONSE REGULATOR PROTEIN-CheY-like nd an HD-GYP domain [hydrothermal vent metagenome]|uniref:RESPONSE REGULATOR PROTEIN-CheY-like nd an HD-GYP domain n=1 Tax=hydrothermal vent metagenome TaxID=652676 RepID=A0A1W1BRD9_9ZZZZ
MQKKEKSLGSDEILELVFIYLAEVSSLKDYDEILEVLAHMGKVLTNADRCTVWVVSDDDTEIWTKVAQGIDTIHISKSSGIVGTCISSGKRLIIDDVYEDPRFNKEIDSTSGYKTKSMMVIPMYDYDDNIIGAFQVINHQGEKTVFDSRDMQHLTLASSYAAETLSSVKLANEIEETQKEIVLTMGSISESRSKETGNHVKRVAEYSKLLALAYGLSEEDAELLKQASPMHDIGKVAIPDSILNKPGRFDENERFIMDTHAELGYQMIKNSERPLLKAASIVAREHHEKWDGTGYPRKLAGEDIHIFGRITAIADVFDALGSDRVYKKAWPDEKIFQLLRDERGTHFDPKLIDLFFAKLDLIKEVRETFKDIYIPKPDLKRDKQITILGAYGTKAKGYGTTAFYLNSKNVIDAGNLLEPLNIESIDIENVWMTHSHLDHIIDIAYILDNYFNLRKKSLNIVGCPDTIKAIKENFLNNTIWPDFSKIPLTLSGEMAVTYTELELNKEYSIGQDESIRAFKTDHTVPSSGYVYTKKNASVLITADTFSLDSAIKEINENKNMSSIVVECSFPSEMRELAINSKHLTPELLFEKLEAIKREDIVLYIHHIKPAFFKRISDEIAIYKGKWETKILEDGFFVNF